MSANIKALLGQADNDPEKFAALLLGETLRVLKLAYGEGNEAFHTYDEALEHAESNIRDHFEIPEDLL